MKVEFAADWVSDGLQGTAMHAVNAIPHVCDAPAGIKTFLELPSIHGWGVGPVSKKSVSKKSAPKKKAAKK